MNKNIILAGVVAIGIYLLSQLKKIPFITGAQKTAQRRSSATTSTVRKRTAQKIAQKIAQKVAQKIAPKRIGQPTTQAARIAAARKAAAQRAAAQRAAAQRAAAQRVAAQRAAIRKAAAQKIGKKIGKTVAQSVAQKIKARRAAMARVAKRQGPQIQRPNPNKKRVVSWKAPYRFPKSKFRVITPSDKLRNLAKKDIARKKAVQQKTTQKTTHSTPSARRKNRLEALYGSHWHDIWIKRQKRR